MTVHKQQDWMGAITGHSHYDRTVRAGLLVTGLLLWNSGCQQSAPDPVVQQTTEQKKSAAERHPLDELGATETLDFHAGAEQPMLQVRPASQTNIRQNSLNHSAENPLGMSTSDIQTQQLAPVSGTPEWDIQQIAAILGEAKQKPSSSTAPEQFQVSEEQNRRIVGLATHAISLTHSRPEKELLFNTAIHSLIDARVQLALAGDQKSLDALYEDAATLSEKHPQSSAAAAASGGVVRLAREMASLEDRQSPWVSEYVRQAKLFAANYPGEEARAIVQLTSAAEFCEQRQLVLPAIECYTFIQQKFPKSPFSQRCETALQRLNLIGKPLALQGPTLSGEQVQLADLAGRPVLVAFWSARSVAFQEDLPVIQDLCKKSGCQLVGINMDTSEQTARQFVDGHQLAGTHIFYADPTLQGAAQPLVRQFGIHNVPSYWLVDKEGKVLSTCVSRDQLRALVQ